MCGGLSSTIVGHDGNEALFGRSASYRNAVTFHSLGSRSAPQVIEARKDIYPEGVAQTSSRVVVEPFQGTNR